jgi:hypothetical protein
MTQTDPGTGAGPAAPLPVRRTPAWRIALAAFGCLLLLGFAGGMLWWQDWRYTLPTPRPSGLVQAVPGTPISLAHVSPDVPRAGGRPVLLHFFNPRCPCSRFNLDHVRGLQQRWANKVEFIAVVQGCKPRDARRALARAGLDMPAIADPDGRIAERCGVYSSPQAVLLDPEGRLYFRGNYNTSRYCTTEATEFARLALDSLAAGAPPPRFAAAGIAYGCELPSWKRRHG